MTAIAALAWFVAGSAHALPEPIEVAPEVYAIVGDLGAQTYENEGLNANLGFVVGGDAVLAVNSGPSRRIAEELLAAIRRTTSKPVKWVVNLNSQSHYWLGNGVFKQIGAKLLAHPEAIDLMREQGRAQQETLQHVLRDRFDGTELVAAEHAVPEKETINLGRRHVEIRHLGHAHTPGDLIVSISDYGVVFTGDLVYTERLLAVLPISQSKGWLAAFRRLEALSPRMLVPGHGQPTDLPGAREATFAYLTHLRTEAEKQFRAGVNPSEAAQRIDQSRWRMLQNFEALAKRNASQVFLEVERESF
jgi:glyoxylase-like metal-dependent hydrolase (beta-lactamase superfamily II)